MLTILLSFLVGATDSPTVPSDAFFAPSVKVGDIFNVHESQRISGTLGQAREQVQSFDAVMRSVSSDEHGVKIDISIKSMPAFGSQSMTFQSSGAILGTDLQPIRNHFLIAPLYDQTFFGTPPANIGVGTSWTVNLQPWRLGPAGEAIVTVSKIDKNDAIVELSVKGEGFGTLGEDAENDRVSISDGSHSASLESAPQKSQWTATLKVQAGVIISESATVKTQWRIPSSEMGPASTYVETHTGNFVVSKVAGSK